MLANWVAAEHRFFSTMKFQTDGPIMSAKNFKNLLSLWLVSTPTQSQTCQHNPWNTWSRLALLASCTAFMSWPTVHAQVSVETKQAGVNARIEVLGEIYALPQAVSASQSRLVVYRTAESRRLEGATSLFINGQYHTSLVPDGYHFLCLNPGEVELGTRQSVLAVRLGTNTTPSRPLDLTEAKHSFSR